MKNSDRKKQSEKLVERKFASAVEQAGGMAIKMALTGAAGFPDRLVLMPGGKAAFVECKTTGEKLRELQKWWRRKLMALGFFYGVLDHTEDIPSTINILKDL